MSDLALLKVMNKSVSKELEDRAKAVLTMKLQEIKDEDPKALATFALAVPTAPLIALGAACYGLAKLFSQVKTYLKKTNNDMSQPLILKGGQQENIKNNNNKPIGNSPQNGSPGVGPLHTNKEINISDDVDTDNSQSGSLPPDISSSLNDDDVNTPQVVLSSSDESIKDSINYDDGDNALLV